MSFVDIGQQNNWDSNDKGINRGYSQDMIKQIGEALQNFQVNLKLFLK
jgi:hypothetical protein